MSKRSCSLLFVILILISCFAVTNAAVVYKPNDAALVPSPSFIDFPTFTHPSTAKSVPVILHNTGNTDLTFTSISKIEDSCKGPGCGPTGWLNFYGAPASILATDSGTMTLVLNSAGVITSGPTRLWGRIVFNYDSPSQSVTLPISLTVADTIQDWLYDTVTTAANISLLVSNNGDMGGNSMGGVNMNFRPPIECDTGSNSRGNASVYLGDGSPVIVRKVGSNTARLSFSMYGNSPANPNGFKPLATPSPQFKDTSLYQSYFSGEFLSVDSLVKIRKTWFAPKTSPDTASFVIEKLQITPNPDNVAVTNLQIGEAFDWDIPSDSGNNSSLGGYGDVSGFDGNRRLVWARGFNSSDTITDCWNNSYRFGGSALLFMGLKVKMACGNTSDFPYGAYSVANDSFVYPTSGLVPEQTWNNMKDPGYTVEPRVTDIHIMLTFKGGATGFTLPANDTLTVFTVMAVTRNAATVPAGLDSLKAYIVKAQKWTDKYVRGCSGCCCFGTRGNVNMVGGIDLADLSALVSYLSGGGYVLSCKQAADSNGDGRIDLGDLSCTVFGLTAGGSCSVPCSVGPQCDAYH